MDRVTKTENKPPKFGQNMLFWPAKTRLRRLGSKTGLAAQGKAYGAFLPVNFVENRKIYNFDGQILFTKAGTGIHQGRTLPDKILDILKTNNFDGLEWSVCLFLGC